MIDNKITVSMLNEINAKLPKLCIEPEHKNILSFIYSDICSLLFHICIKKRGNKLLQYIPAMKLSEALIKELYNSEPIYINALQRDRIKCALKYSQLPSFYFAFYDINNLNEFKKISSTILFLIHSLVTATNIITTDITKVVCEGYKLQKFCERMYLIGACMMSDEGKLRLQKQQRKGQKTSGIYDMQRGDALSVYINFKEQYPELVKEYQKHPNKAKPKTMLKNMLTNKITCLTDRTLSNWANKLLKTDGVI